MKVVAAFPTAEEAHVAASRLESAGIETEVRDDATVSLNWFYSPVIGGVRIAVGDSDVPDALAILHMPALEEGILRCPHCGSHDVHTRVFSPAGAFCALFSLPIPLPLQTVDCRACGRSHDIKSHPNSAD